MVDLEANVEISVPWDFVELQMLKKWRLRRDSWMDRLRLFKLGTIMKVRKRLRSILISNQSSCKTRSVLGARHLASEG